MKNNKWIYLIVFGLVLNIVVGVVSGNVFFNDTDVYLHCDDNEVYKVDTSKPFSHVVVDGSFVQFNNTAFRCDFDEDVNVTLLFLNELYPYGNLTILSFTYEQGNGVSLHDFNLSGFLTYTAYQVYTNNTLLDTVISDGSEGWVNFTSDILFGRVDIVWHIMICYAGCDYDPLFDEVPLNNSYQFFQPDGFWTTINFEYTNFDNINRYEYFTNTTDLSSHFFNMSAQTFNISTVGVLNESMILSSVNLYLTASVDDLKLYIEIVNVNETGVPDRTDVLTDGFVYIPYHLNDWVNISVDPVWLSNNTEYAIICYAAVEDTEYWAWYGAIYDDLSNYEGGQAWYSYDEGNTWTEVSGALEYTFLFEVYGTNLSNFVNVTFDWYNDSLSDWEQYGFMPHVANFTVSFFNSNFSGIDTYIWRVHAIASDTGVTHSETYSFTTFYLPDPISRASMGIMLACTLLIAVFWLMWKRRRKKDEKKTY